MRGAKRVKGGPRTNVLHNGGVCGHALQRDFVLEGLELRERGNLDGHPPLRGAHLGGRHGGGGGLCRLGAHGVRVRGVPLRPGDGGVGWSRELVAPGQLGGGALHVELQRIQHLVRVLVHLCFGDATGAQHGLPLGRQPHEAVGGILVHLHVVLMLHIEGSADKPALVLVTALLPAVRFLGCNMGRQVLCRYCFPGYTCVSTKGLAHRNGGAQHSSRGTAAVNLRHHTQAQQAGGIETSVRQQNAHLWVVLLPIHLEVL